MERQPSLTLQQAKYLVYLGYLEVYKRNYNDNFVGCNCLDLFNRLTLLSPPLYVRLLRKAGRTLERHFVSRQNRFDVSC